MPQSSLGGKAIFNRFARENGAPGRTRTCDLRLRRPLLYPAELLALMVGAAGFEPAAYCSQSSRANQAALRPVTGHRLRERRRNSKDSGAMPVVDLTLG